MSWQIIPLADVPPSPWENGGGVTRELVAWPNAKDWLWRMSVAEVGRNGPFSRFEGVQRWFAVLSGAGVQLDISAEVGLAAQMHTLTGASAPLCFAGEWPVQCTLLDGPTQDFNLMLRHAHATARMLRVQGEFFVLPKTARTIAVLAQSTGARVQLDDDFLALPPNTLAWRHCPAGARLQITATDGLWMEITS